MFRKHEAYDLWVTGDTTGDPSHVVDLHQIGHLSPNPWHCPGLNMGLSMSWPFPVELLVSEKFRRQDRLVARRIIIDLP